MTRFVGGGGGDNPFSGASQPPKFSLTGLVINTLLITPLVLPQIEYTGHDWAKHLAILINNSQKCATELTGKTRAFEHGL